jgi:hypothetical protein
MTQDRILVDTTPLKLRMGISPDLDVDDALNEAVAASQLRIGAHLDSVLAQGVYSDTFYLDGDVNSGLQPGGLFRLLLRNGFVATSPTPLLYTGSTWDSVTTAADPTKYKVDLVKGIVYADAIMFANTFIRVDYTAGFLNVGLMPDWLNEAIYAYVPAVFNMGSSGQPKDETQGYKQAVEHAMGVLAKYNRNIGLCLRPVI